MLTGHTRLRKHLEPEAHAHQIKCVLPRPQSGVCCVYYKWRVVPERIFLLNYRPFVCLDVMHITGRIAEIPTTVKATLEANEIWTFTLNAGSLCTLFKPSLVVLAVFLVLA